MGWAMLALVVAFALGVLAWFRLPRALWTSVGTVLMLGAAGYALQGAPTLPGAVPHPLKDPSAASPALSELRSAMWGRFTEEAAYEAAFDALLRDGDTRSAVTLAVSGIRKYPNSAELWTDLGSALVANDHTLSPPARYAFMRAIAITPHHPAPYFFLGMGMVEAGQYADARTEWAAALARTPERASYRSQIADRLAALDRVIAITAR